MDSLANAGLSANDLKIKAAFRAKREAKERERSGSNRPPANNGIMGKIKGWIKSKQGDGASMATKRAMRENNL